MNVKELRELLARLPDEAPVLATGQDGESLAGTCVEWYPPEAGDPAHPHGFLVVEPLTVSE